jgi:hypothetical protein
MGIVSGLAALLAVVLYGLIVKRIQHSHPNEWEKLGSPGVLHDPTQPSSLRLAEYVWKGRWMRLHDKPLLFLCGGFYSSVVLMIGTFVTALFF